jgi:2-polyprenyl-3-methyl-5-hydroxy-6-metoxy-1,4-benzoquinol methylase
MTTTPAALDMEIVQGFAFKVFGDLTAQQMGALTTVGDRLGLFTTLAESGPVTSSQFAVQAGVHERYAREWLAAMACHGYLTYEATTAEFELPREHAFVLAQPESPLYLGSVFAMSQAYWKHIDLLTEAFKHGGGIPQNEFGEQFWCGFERFTAASFNNFLVQEWIPAMPSVDAALRLGGTAADVGCGNGQALLTLARGYRNASLVGYDNYAPAIAAATVNARAAGLDDRVRYELRDVTQGIPATYDLITMFDVVHDAPHPVQLLSAVAGALKPGGTCFILEFNLHGDVQRNIEHPLKLGAFGYSASLNYCMTQALAVGGEGTGTCMGEERLREVATAAGFGKIVRLDFPNNPFNVFYTLNI